MVSGTKKCDFCKDASKIKTIFDFAINRKANGETGTMLETFITLENQLHFEVIDFEREILEKQYLEINYCPVCGKKLSECVDH